MNKFDETHKYYDRLKSAVEEIIRQLLDQNGVEVFRIESRLKDRKSLEEKIGRTDKKEKYENLEDITDICGIRVIAFSKEDCSNIVLGIRDHFIVDEDNSVDKSAEIDEDRFGYSSTHLIISLPESRCVLFENRGLEGLKAEIQIKTVLQHAWAVFDWNLRYKSEIEVPKELKRKLYRLSALLEAADDAFSDIKLSAEQLKRSYKLDALDESSMVGINKDSVYEYIVTSKQVQNLFNLARMRGVNIVDNIDIDDLAPWSYLISSIRAAGIDNIGNLDKVLRLAGERGLDILSRVNELWNRRIFGSYSPIRIFILSTLDKDVALKVIEEVPSAGDLHAAEMQALRELGSLYVEVTEGTRQV